MLCAGELRANALRAYVWAYAGRALSCCTREVARTRAECAAPLATCMRAPSASWRAAHQLDAARACSERARRALSIRRVPGGRQVLVDGRLCSQWPSLLGMDRELVSSVSPSSRLCLALLLTRFPPRGGCCQQPTPRADSPLRLALLGRCWLSPRASGGSISRRTRKGEVLGPRSAHGADKVAAAWDDPELLRRSAEAAAYAAQPERALWSSLLLGLAAECQRQTRPPVCAAYMCAMRMCEFVFARGLRGARCAFACTLLP